MVTAKLGHRHAALGLAQDRKDLGFAVSGHLHLNLLMHLAEKILLSQPLTFRGDYRSTMVTSNLPFDEWTSVFGSERLTGALLDRLTHHVHILEMNGDSFRLAHSKRRSRRTRSEHPSETAPEE